MASLVARAKLLKNLRYFTTTTTRPLNSSTPSSSSSTSATAATAFSALNLAAADTKIEPTTTTTTTTTTTIPKSTSTLDFDDVDKLFSSVSTSKLLRASANLHMAAVEPIVDLGMWVMKSKLMEKQLVKDMILGLIKRTFFEHFCAGENTVEAGNSALRLRDAGLRGMLDYALEFACDNESCDQNMEGFLTTIESTKSLPPSIVSFVVVKISAICPLRLLERVSDLLRWQHKNPSFSLPWKLNTLPIFSDSSPTYHTLTEPQPLTPEEERDLQLAHERLLRLCQECLAHLPLLVDAEHTHVQPAIDYLTYSSAIMYNKDDNPIVYGTLQAYLKDARDRLFLATKAAEKMGVALGVKLVRGAYMSSERELASSLGYESPIHNTIQDTHSSFNDCASFMLERLANGSDALVLATHNVQSGKLAAAKAHDLGIGRVNQKLEFAQLYGMADSLSYGLGNAGFQVSKYMPFGPIEVVMPYLLRRAEENRGMLSSSTLDRELMRKELKRRLIAAVL